MANTIQIKRSAVQGRAPTTAQLELGELAVNTYDGLLYLKKRAGEVESIVQVNGAGSDAVNTKITGPDSATDHAVVRYDGTTGKLAQNSSVTISDAGEVSHQGLVPTTGTAIDQIKQLTVNLALTTEWQDTGINGADLATGSYLLQLYANDAGNGGGNVTEYYTGTLSWYAGATDSTEADEILMHRAGAGTDGNLYVRTQRTAAGDGRGLVLEMRSNLATGAASPYLFTFRRLL